MNKAPSPSAPPPSASCRWDPLLLHRPIFWMSFPRLDAHSFLTPLHSPQKSEHHRTDDETVLLVHRRPNPPPGNKNPPSPVTPPRVYVPMPMRSWVLHTFHATTSCHLGVSRTTRLIAHFFWWIGVSITTYWWIRRCLECRARKTSRQGVRWPSLSLHLPDSPGITVSVDYFGPLALTPRGNLYASSFSLTASAAAPTCLPSRQRSSQSTAPRTSSSTSIYCPLSVPCDTYLRQRPTL